MYVTRTWLSPLTHSSGFIMCYYDPNCLNNECNLFVRLSDCLCATSFYFEQRQISKMLQFIDGVVAVIEKRRRSYTVSITAHRYRLKLTEFVDWANLSIHCDNGGKNEKLLTNIHYDKYTCTKEEWETKKALLVCDLLAFKTFLTPLLRKTKRGGSDEQQ